MKFLKSLYHVLERKQASFLMSRKKVKVIGITGSYGKTNTAVAVSAVLSEKYTVAQTDLNLDTFFSLPRLIRSLKNEQYAVVELGVDGVGQMRQYLKMVKPRVGILTGIAPVHTDTEHFGSMEALMKEKSELLAALPKEGLLVCNFDDPRVKEMAKVTKAKIAKYGSSVDCAVRILQTTVSLHGTIVELKTNKETLSLKLKLIGKHHAYTAAAATAVGLEEGLTANQIKNGLEKIQPLQGRMSLEAGPAGTIILNDSRRANLASTLAGLETLVEIESARKIAVLGQMAEMGDYEESGHRQVGKKVASMSLDYLVCVGPTTKLIAEEAKKGLDESRVFYAADVFEAAAKLKELLKPGDLWYLKGSLLKHMERIPLILAGKEVDSDEIASHRYQIYT